MPFALPLLELSSVVMFIVALGLCLLALVVIIALFAIAEKAVGWLPWVGPRIQGDLHRTEQRLTHALGKAVGGLQHRIGTTWHAFAHLVDEIGAKIAGAFELLYALEKLTGALASWKGVLALYRSLVGKERATISNVKENTKTARQAKTHATHAFKTANVAKVRAQAIPADVVLPRDLTGLRGRVREAEHEIGRLWDRVRGIGTGAVVGLGLGALTFALGRLGVGWARCSNVGKVGRNVCEMDHGFLDSLLAGSLAILGTISLVELAHAMLSVEDEMARAVRFGFREFSHITVRSAEQQGFVTPG